MDDKLKFQEALVSLQNRAEEQGGVLTIEEMQDCLKNMNFNQEQLGMISAYLTGKGIHVEGAELPEEEFLVQYRKELKSARRQPEDRLEILWQQVKQGEGAARELLAEHYMEKVLAVAEEYAHQGILIQDLVQEGSLGLLMGLNSFGQPEDLEPEEHLEREIRKSIRQAMEEQNGESSVGEEVTRKLNRLADSIKELNEYL